MHVKLFLLMILGAVILSACSTTTVPAPTETATTAPSPTETVTSTITLTVTSEDTATASPSPTVTRTPTVTLTSTITPTPTRTLVPSPTVTPTRDYPDAVVNQQANCRYGPGTAYLYRWGLYEGDKAEVHGRNWSGSWLWLKPANLDNHCWASEIVVDIDGDKMSVPVVQSRLPHTTFAGPPPNVVAVRNGNEVTVTWDKVDLSEDKRRGYLIEAMVCQNGAYFPMIVQTDETTYTFTDEAGCATPSSGLLYTAEKHGYSDPVQIPWPEP